MARLLTAGAEAGLPPTSSNTGVVDAPATFDGAGGTGTVQGTIDSVLFRSGAASYKFVTAASTFVAVTELDIAAVPSSSSVSFYTRIYVNITTMPTSTAKILTFQVTNIASIRLTSAGKLQLFNDAAGTQVGADSAAISTGQWYAVELGVTYSAIAGTISALEARLDHVTFASTSGLSSVGGAIIALHIGFDSNTGAAATMNVDDIAINDSTGGNQNSWPGPGKVVLLLPTSDNSRGSWTGGAGGITNLFDGINNTPPIGTASETNLTQIENTVSGATLPNGDFNMTTYAAAGIAAGDTVNCVVPIIAHGEDVSTGTKTGTFKIVSNPDSGTADDVGDQGTSQFGPSGGGALGTYPSNWITQRGAYVYSPTVAVGTAPVARITKTDTGTRVASLCFMGIYVDYTPSSGRQPRHPGINHQNPGIL